MKHRVIKYANLPARLPLWNTAICWLLLDRLQPPGWVWGVVGAILVFYWLLALYVIGSQQQVDVLEIPPSNGKQL